MAVYVSQVLSRRLHNVVLNIQENIYVTDKLRL